MTADAGFWLEEYADSSKRIAELTADIDTLNADIAALKAMLKKHQYLVGYCRGCGNHRADGCKPECEINQLLEDR